MVAPFSFFFSDDNDGDEVEAGVALIDDADEIEEMDLQVSLLGVL